MCPKSRLWHDWSIALSYLNDPFEWLLEEFLHDADLDPHHAVRRPTDLTTPVLGKGEADLKINKQSNLTHS